MVGDGALDVPLHEDFVYPASKEETIPFPLAETARLKFSRISSKSSHPCLITKKDSVSLSRTRGKCSVGAYLCVRPSIEIRFTLHLVHFTAGASPRPTIIDIVSREGECEISHKNKKTS